MLDRTAPRFLGLIRRPLSLAITVALWPQMALSQEPAPAAATELDAIEVTGSRISRVDAIAESPIYTVDREDLIDSGYITVDQYLNTLPQIVPSVSSQSNNPSSNGRAFIDLRGLGAGRNLILIDGRRPMGQASGGTIVDTNTIPAALVDRIEIITGGAAATYGADAIAGVINFIMKKDFQGFALDSQFRRTAEKDGIERGTSLTLGSGFNGGKGSAVFSANYFSRDAIYKDARGFSAQASGTTGTFPGGSYSAGINEPSQAAVDALFGANLCNRNGGQVGFGFNPDASLFCTGVGGDATRDVVGYTGPQDDIATAFFPDFFSYNFEPDNILVLPLERSNLFTNINLDVSQYFNPYVQMSFTNYNALQELAPTPAGGFVVPVTNPFIPSQLSNLLASRPVLPVTPATPAGSTGPTVPFIFNKRFNALGGRTGYNTHDVWQLTAGTKGYLGEGWNYDAYGSWGRSVLDEIQGGNVRLPEVTALLAAADGGASLCAGGLNLFGAAPISKACQDRISLEAKNLTVAEQGIAEVEFTGTLLQLPAGPIQAALGGSYRNVDFDFRPDSGLKPGLVAGFNEQLPVSGRLDYTDYFWEMHIPIIADMPLVQSLSASAGFRNTDNNRFGKANTYKLTMDWTVNDAFRARGGFQHAIRSPNIAELFAPQVNNFPAAADPCNTTGANSFNSQFGRNATHNGRSPTAATDPGTPLPTVRAQVQALCQAQSAVAGGASFNQPASQVRAIVGGNPNLEEETADSWSIGLVATPKFDAPLLERLTVTVDYFSIEVEDVIAAVGALTIMQRCFNRDGANPGYSISNSWCSLFIRDQSNGGVIDLKQFAQNQALLSVSGIDLTTNWGFKAGPGQLDFALLLTMLDEFKQQTTNVDPVNDFSGTIGSGTGTAFPEWKGTFLTAYSWNSLSLQATSRYISAMGHANVVTGGSPASNTGVDATWYFDIAADYTLRNNLSLRAGINNVDNQRPRLYTPNVQANTDPSTYDVLGRRFFVGFNLEL